MKPIPSIPTSPPSAALDMVGGTASAACAVHCALIPVAFALLPSATHSIGHNVVVESIFIVTAALFATFVIGHASRRHREPLSLVLLLLGLTVMAYSLFGAGHSHSGGHALTAASGGMLIAAAHWSNWHSTRRWRAALRDEANGETDA
ncbi:MAG: MerC domain-containing protein [Lysobacterales bacterium]